jgi:hypothetical protein
MIGGKEVAAGKLAFDYQDSVPNAKNLYGYTRIKVACEAIEKRGEVFASAEAAYPRITQVLKELAERAVKPLVREPQAARVAAELEYYPGEIVPALQMKFEKTYETTWDTSGGWGAEYHPFQAQADNPVTPYWVIHVHRGPNGVLTAARVKLWGQRAAPQSGSVLTRPALVTGFGIPAQDNTITHTQTRLRS